MKRATVTVMDPDFEMDSEGERGWEYSVEDYIRIEEESENVKHEFDNGQIRAMGGGTSQHARLATALAVQLGLQLRGKRCAMFSSDGRVRVGGLITYPDLSIACERSEVDDVDTNAQINPTVLVEVTSRWSEHYDRGKKRKRYQRIASLRDYVIVSHRERAIDVYSRDEHGRWPEKPVRYEAGQFARVTSIDCTIDVSDLYIDPRSSRS